MKKIFAIALALVMVLSMASAFAAVGGVQCYTPAYTCPTVGCGVAKAEVVQFAANNTIDGYEETACAGVVGGQNIFYGVKVTFDADVNAQWFEHANTKFSIVESNINNAADWTSNQLATMFTTTKTAGDVSGKVFWYDFTTNKLVSDWSASCVKTVVATNTKAKVCADVDYVFDGITGSSMTLDYTDFDAQVISANNEYEIKLIKAGKTLNIKVTGGVAKYATFDNSTWYYAENGVIMAIKNGTYANGKVTGDPATVVGLSCDDIDEYLALIGIKLGDCVTASTIKAIFGWDDADKFMSCKTWNKDALAIVNAECQVQVMSIPKTGDASVLAWLF